MTLYYRLIGAPGEVAEIAFCDNTMVRNGVGCYFNGVLDIHEFDLPLLSTRNQSGFLTIHDGPVTRPERPPEPPEAVVYEELPDS